MYKFAIFFKKPLTNTSRFDNNYNDFLALIERMPDIKRRQVVHITGSPLGNSPFYRVLEVYFEDRPQMEAALNSPAGQEAGAELTRNFPANSFDMVFGEVYEEAGGATEQPPSDDTAKD
jgi:uncharacterized protein (TIGR02118 family)